MRFAECTFACGKQGVYFKASEESLRLTIKAADLGMFDMDLVNGTMFWDARCRELFGISHQNPVTYTNDFLPGLHPDDRERIIDVIRNYVYNKSLSNGDYDVEYRTIGVNDNKLRWIRAKGKTYFNENNEPVHFTGTALDITEQKLIELRKDEFISIASHELKTPLTSIKSYIQILLAKVKKENDEFKIQSLLRADKQINKMTSLIHSFLDNAKILEGKLELNKTAFNLDALLLEVVDDAKIITQTHRFELNDCDEVSVIADRDKIGQVVENLISNAIKYSPAGSIITISCKINKKFATIAVADQGVGIEKKHHQKLFDRFYRVENEKIKNTSGFGIGLYLVAEILRQHNTCIFLKSSLKSGSKFYFKLPISQSIPTNGN